MSKGDIMVLLIALLFTGLYSQAARSQLVSPALDSTCYQPIVGESGEVDLVTGSYVGQGLGSVVYNVGPKPADATVQNLLAWSPPSSSKSGVSRIEVGPGFNPKSAPRIFLPGFLETQFNYIHFVHLRSRMFTDILMVRDSKGPMLPKIYWADENGSYDTSRYTELTCSKLSANDLGVMTPYHDFISSSSYEDLILMYNQLENPGVNTLIDTTFIARYVGGDSLYKVRARVEPTEIAFVDTVHKHDGGYGPGRLSFSGDFRALGKKGCLIFDVKYNWLYVQPSTPFSLRAFAHDMTTDTLLSRSETPWYKTPQGTTPVVIGPLISKTGSTAEDFALTIDSGG